MIAFSFNLRVFQGQYLPSLSINYVTINKDLRKITTTDVQMY